MLRRNVYSVRFGLVVAGLIIPLAIYLARAESSAQVASGEWKRQEVSFYQEVVEEDPFGDVEFYVSYPARLERGDWLSGHIYISNWTNYWVTLHDITCYAVRNGICPTIDERYPINIKPNGSYFVDLEWDIPEDTPLGEGGIRLAIKYYHETPTGHTYYHPLILKSGLPNYPGR